MVNGLDKLLADSRVLLVLGPGGVGKTTMSLGLAFAAASEGRRVAVLSIDPAKRLAAALGMPLGSELRRLDLSGQITGPGTIDAAMLDQGAVFDEMVKRFAPSASAAAKIHAHPFYRAMRDHLGGAIEYMALAKLSEIAARTEYDLIVVDTPPDAHALDFLARPNLLAGFVEHKVIGWLLKPFLLAQKVGLGRLMSAGEKLMGGLAAMTGLKALQMMAEFLVLLQDVIEGFHRAGQTVQSILADRRTKYILIAASRRAPVRSASMIVEQLHAMGKSVALTIINREMPVAVKQVLLASSEQDLAADARYAAILNLRRRAQSSTTVSAALARRQFELWHRLPLWLEVPESNEDLCSSSELLKLSAQLLELPLQAPDML